MENSGILLVVSEPSHRAILSAVLTANGEHVEGVENPIAGLEAMRSRAYDLILIDLDPADGDVFVGDVRSVSKWSRSVPIVSLTPVESADAMLPKPFRATELAAALRRWLGEDRMIAHPDQQGEKLAALLGADQAGAMIDRLHANLGEALGQVEAGGDARAIGHRVGGIAGMLGFDVMRTAWLGLEEHGMVAWPMVRVLTLETIERHQPASPPPGA